jgi:hypothetical protein
MTSTTYSSGGEVEHEVSAFLNIHRLSDGCLVQLFMIGGIIIFFVIEMKLAYDVQDNVAQLFLELLCKPTFPSLSYAELVYSGRRNEQECQISRSAYVHGLLTDLQAFHFHTYDQSRRKIIPFVFSHSDK